MADIDNEAIVHDPDFAVQPDTTPSIDEQVYGDGMAEPEALHEEPDGHTSQDPKHQIAKQIADHEKWMTDHTDDARGVQERLQQIAVLQQKLVEFDAPKHETRVRQTQTV